MRKSGVLLLLMLISLIIFSSLILFNGVFVVADVDINNFTFPTSYSPFQLITGEINVTIEDEDYDFILNSNLNETGISLGDFLDDNGYLSVDFCVPSDCSKDYSYSSGLTNKIINIQAGETHSAGFVLNGNNVEVTGLSFELESDFPRDITPPIEINFFENDLWRYKEFSNEYSTKDYGCYDITLGVVGPLIRYNTSKYCEKISITESDSLEIGAVVDSGDTKDLKMNVYSDFSGSSLGSCKFTPASEAGCEVYADLGDVYEEGDYYVCVSALEGDTTNYHLYTEVSGVNCGFVYSFNPGNFTKDYAIFARAKMYEAAETSGQSNLNITSEEFDDFIVSANLILNERYGGDCSSGCVLPFTVEGVSQNFKIKNLVLDYRSNGEDKEPEDKTYDLEVESASIDFSGVLDLELLGIEVPLDTEEFILYLNDDEIFSEDINLVDAPIVTSISPNNPPAGLSITFYAGVAFSGNISSYVWDFGDNTTETTSIGEVEHTYDEVDNYTLSLEVFSGNLSNSQSFSIEAMNPKKAINLSLEQMNNYLDNVTSEINKFPLWYQDVLKETARTVFYRGELDKLEREFKQEAFTNDDYVEIAKEVFALDVPRAVHITEQSSGPLLTELNDIDALPVQMVGGGSQENLDNYKNSILRWQSENIVANVLFKRIILIKGSGEVEDVMAVYDINVKSNANEESYFIIMKNYGDLIFNSANHPGARKEGDATAIVLDKEEEKDIEFYYLTNTGEAGLFVSPKLSHLVLEEDIDTTCDHDGICEDSEGENPRTCRDDCGPGTGRVMFWIFVSFFVFIFMVILYTAIQVWYKLNYETHLFKDRRHLYNLLMFIANARAQGLDEGSIRNNLKGKWTREQINYALKKSKGQRTGMYEIIPIEKIFAGLRQRKANKNFAAGKYVAEHTKINKPLMRIE